MCTSTKKGVWAGEEDEIRGSHLDWRLEIVEGQRGLWSVTQATALAKKKKNPQSSRAWSGREASLLSSFLFRSSLALLFRFISSWGLTNGASNMCHRTMVEASRWGENNGIFFCPQNITRVSASLCLITLETKLARSTSGWSCGIAGTLWEDVNPGLADSNDLH